MKKKLIFLTAVLLVIISFFALVRHQSRPDPITVGENRFAFSWVSAGVTQYSRSSLWEEEESDKLFLPAYVDLNDTIMRCDGGWLVVNGVRYDDGCQVSKMGLELQTPYYMELYNAAGDRMGGGDITIYQDEGDVPSLFLNLESGSMRMVNYAGGESFTEGLEAQLMLADGSRSLCSDGFIRGRGNNSWYFPKKGYLLDFGKELSPLGMSKSEKWILLSNYQSPEQLKNVIAYEFSDLLGLNYTPEYRYVQLYLNGDYNGLYLLTSKIEIGSNRVDIRDLEKRNRKLDSNWRTAEIFTETRDDGSIASWYGLKGEPTDVSGGYLVEFEYHERINDGGYYITSRDHLLNVEGPKHITKGEMDYLSDFLQQAEDAVFSEDGVNPITGKRIEDYLDLDSWIAKMVLEEGIMNIDGDVTSAYAYKLPDALGGKLYAGPVWDYDESWRLTIGDYRLNAQWVMADAQHDMHWMYRLYQHPEIRERVMTLYEQKLSPAIHALIDGGLDERFEKVRSATVINDLCWESDAEESLEKLREAMRQRVEFMDDLWINRTPYTTLCVYSSATKGDNQFVYHVESIPLGSGSFDEQLAKDLLHQYLENDREITGWVDLYTGEEFRFDEPPQNELYHIGAVWADVEEETKP